MRPEALQRGRPGGMSATVPRQDSPVPTMTDTTFYWHDYESFGAEPRRDRPAQFAGQRTTLDLEPVGDPLVIYCQPVTDLLPHPEACLITGITPQQAQAEGMPEPQFIARIVEELGRPGTCGVGYNSLRFDDELTRHTLWRNFHDPYAREWRDGCSRWDLIDAVRLVYALRPEDIVWPSRDNGAPSFRLEHLAEANGLVKTRAHDALSDVHTTIALARLLKTRKPKLLDYVFTHRDKRSARALLDPDAPQMVLHVSQRFPAATGCISPVLPIAVHPTNNNAVICFDLRHDPADLLQLPPDELFDRLFTPVEDLPEDVQRLPLKGVKLNHCPVLAPVSTLKGVDLQRLALDMTRCEAHAQTLMQHMDAVRETVTELFSAQDFAPSADPEQGLYDGFVGDGDRRRCEEIRQLDGEGLRAIGTPFADERLNALLQRYRARHFPDSLSEEEAQAWAQWRENRLLFAPDGGLTLDDYDQLIQALRVQRTDDASQSVLDTLAEWGDQLRQSGR